MEAIRFLNAGESHGPELTCIVEGLPAGLAVDVGAIDQELARRQRGFGSGGRMRIESDRVRITSGVTRGVTTGGPIAMRVANRDFKNWRAKDIDPMLVPRPGHADLVGALKYGYDDLRPSLERASARETTTRVAVGALLKQFLEAQGITVGGYVCSIGAVELPAPPSADSALYRERAKRAQETDLALLDPDAYDTARQHITETMKAKDTLGGVFEVFAVGLKPGIGSFMHYDRKLDARIGAAMLSIQAIKGVEIGPAFDNAKKRGTQVHDALSIDRDAALGTASEDGPRMLRRTSNRAGGLEAGVTTGAPLIARAAMKPISTTLDPIDSVDLKTGEPAPTRYERSDFVAVPRALVVGEAMLAIVLAMALREQLGGDRMSDVVRRYDELPAGSLDDLALAGESYRFDYPSPPDDEPRDG